MNRFVNVAKFLIICAAASYFIGCSNHAPVTIQVNPLDQTDLHIDTDLVGTWKAQTVYSISSFDLKVLPLDSETAVTMMLNEDKTVEILNPSHVIDLKGTWGVTVDRILVVNRSTDDRIATDYHLVTLDTGLKGLIFPENFNFASEKGFAVFAWAKM
jgi:hypothetical protein